MRLLLLLLLGIDFVCQWPVTVSLSEWVTVPVWIICVWWLIHIMWLVYIHTCSFTIFLIVLLIHCCSMSYHYQHPLVEGIGRRQTRGAASAPCPSSRRLSVDNEDDFTPPNLFNVWSSELCHLPERNSSAIDYFLLLFTVAMMWVVLRNTQEYA